MPERTETAYEDIGSHARPTPYDDVRHLDCEMCAAPAGKKCINPITGKTRRIPCWGRAKRSSVPGEERRQ